MAEIPQALAILAGFWVGALVQLYVWLAHPRMRLVATVADLVPSVRMVADYVECFFGDGPEYPSNPKLSGWSLRLRWTLGAAVC